MNKLDFSYLTSRSLRAFKKALKEQNVNSLVLLKGLANDTSSVAGSTLYHHNLNIEGDGIKWCKTPPKWASKDLPDEYDPIFQLKLDLENVNYTEVDDVVSLETIIETARYIAQKIDNSKHVGTEHLLLAILSFKDSEAYKFIAQTVDPLDMTADIYDTLRKKPLSIDGYEVVEIYKVKNETVDVELTLHEKQDTFVPVEINGEINETLKNLICYLAGSIDLFVTKNLTLIDGTTIKFLGTKYLKK